MPLYVFFARIQIEHNKISDNSVQITAGLLKDMPFVIGKIFAWMFTVKDGEDASMLFGIMGLIFLSILINILFHKLENRIKRSLLLCMLITYFLHYFLI